MKNNNSINYNRSYNSILDFEIINGTFEATLESYNEVPAATDPITDRIIRDAYLNINLRLNTGEIINTRWYSKRLSYIMRCISYQLDRTYYKLSELLEVMRTTPITIELSMDPKYGPQVEYDLRKINEF